MKYFAEEAPVPQFPPAEPEVARKPSTVASSKSDNIDSILEELENANEDKQKLAITMFVLHSQSLLLSSLFKHHRLNLDL